MLSMRVGIYDPYLDDLGGGEKYMMTIASCLSKQHRVDVFWNDKKDVEKLQERFLLDFSSINIVPNIFSPKVSFLKRVFETKKYDVIVVLSDGSIPFVLSKKLFLHIQQPIKNLNNNSLKLKFKLFRVSKIFFNSNYSKSFVDKEMSGGGFVLYPPVILNPKEIKKENIILHVGRFRVRNVGLGDYKKQSVMVEVFKEMVDKGLKNWRFIIAIGFKDEDKHEFEKMQKEASGYPIDFCINLDNGKLWDIYNKAKIYWHASGFGEDLEKNPEYAEHFGISTVEAMGAGAVPVVINAGGQKEIVTDNENGFLWNTLEELKEKTLELTKDEKLWEDLSIAARKRAEFFAGDRFCKELEDLIAK